VTKSPGDLVRELGISERKLRHWHARGLIPLETRTPGGHARYTPSEERCVRLVAHCRRAGLRGRRLEKLVGILIPEVEAMIAQALATKTDISRASRG